MSHTQTATGKKDTTAGEQLATVEDVDKLIHIRLAEYHDAHVYEMKKWVWWRDQPFYRRWWVNIMWWFWGKRHVREDR